MAEDVKTAESEKTVEEPFIGTFKDKAAAEEGWKNLEAKLASQGTELGTLRKQDMTAQQTIEGLQAQVANANKPAAPAQDYGKELSAIQKEMSKLDPADETYHTDLMEFMAKSNALAAKNQHEKTLAVAAETFRKELDERDVKATHQAFYKDNPDFNTPEMQMRIKEYLANDTTGMSDQLVAYREIQRDDTAVRATQLEEENTELKRLQELAEGANKTGQVFTKTQSPQQKTNQPRTTGAERNKGMQAALDALR